MSTYTPVSPALAEEANEVLVDIHQRLLAIRDELTYATGLISNPKAARPWAELRPYIINLAYAVSALTIALSATPPERKRQAIQQGKHI